MSVDRTIAAVAPHHAGPTGHGSARMRPGQSDASVGSALPSFLSLMASVEAQPDLALDGGSMPVLDGQVAAAPPFAAEPSALLAQSPLRLVQPPDQDVTAMAGVAGLPGVPVATLPLPLGILSTSAKPIGTPAALAQPARAAPATVLALPAEAVSALAQVLEPGSVVSLQAEIASNLAAPAGNLVALASAGTLGTMVAPGMADRSDQAAASSAARAPAELPGTGVLVAPWVDRAPGRSDRARATDILAGAPVAIAMVADAGNTQPFADPGQLAVQGTPRGTRGARPALDTVSFPAARSRAEQPNEFHSAAGPVDVDGAIAKQSDMPGPAQSETPVGAAKWATNSHSEDRPLPRSLSAPSGGGWSGLWTEHALAGGGGAGNAATFALVAGTTAPETVLAQKVNYWVSRGVQNAELQLEAFGGGLVEISITVHGSEAMVDFRTDQPEARKLLQDAMPQLKDMLKGEGLVLSGGFVGTSSQHDPGAHEPRSSARGNRAQVTGVELQPIDKNPRRVGMQGRTVDLFV